jgi:hypothetical protein
LGCTNRAFPEGAITGELLFPLVTGAAVAALLIASLFIVGLFILFFLVATAMIASNCA